MIGHETFESEKNEKKKLKAIKSGKKWKKKKVTKAIKSDKGGDIILHPAAAFVAAGARGLPPGGRARQH